MAFDRRRMLAALGATAIAGALPEAWGRSHRAATRLLGTWQRGDGWYAGVLELQAGTNAMRELGSIELPTRAHGVALDAAGHLVAMARRPGDWMLRWAGPGHAAQWHWIEPSRAFAGHVIGSPDGQLLYATEIDLESGLGLLGIRDAKTLAKRAEWPTLGRDPHQLAWDASMPGHLVVANGGIVTTPETGRAKLELATMDSSLVRLDARSGGAIGQWRLDDRRLSLRHLAWSADGRTLGIALQAEHDDESRRRTAPALALFDGTRLAEAPAPHALGGYGGDIACTGDAFVVSCPRAGGIARYALDGTWREFIALPEACALATRGRSLWIGGQPRALHVGASTPAHALDTGGRRLDNHWMLLPSVA